MQANEKFEKWLSDEQREEAREAVREHQERNLRPAGILRRPAPEPSPAPALSASLATLAPALQQAVAIPASATAATNSIEVDPALPGGPSRARVIAKRIGEEALLLYYRFYFLSPKGKLKVLAGIGVGVIAIGVLLIAPRRHAHARLAPEIPLERLTSGPVKKAAPPAVVAPVPAPPAPVIAAAKPGKRAPAAKRAAHGKTHSKKAAKKASKGRPQRRSR